ncbi:peamaclein-like [Tasmannia lanceolata]|uniref:peamaclein-like n=1 Tax=Tasmannia lanceolata TaxID=3420 RepID=UPI0040636F55
MASFSFLSSSFLLFLGLVLVVELSNAETTINSGGPTYSPAPAPAPESGPGSVQAKDCPNKCAYRCSATAHKEPCMHFCVMCCTKCLCVPSGTYGHKEECPCYNEWKSKKGKPKCP